MCDTQNEVTISRGFFPLGSANRGLVVGTRRTGLDAASRGGDAGIVKEVVKEVVKKRILGSAGRRAGKGDGGETIKGSRNYEGCSRSQRSGYTVNTRSNRNGRLDVPALLT